MTLSHDDRVTRPGLPPLLTVDDLADWLHVSRRTIDRMVRRGQLPRPLKLGGNRWKVEDIEKALGAIEQVASEPVQPTLTTD